MITEERLEALERELARAKRRNRRSLTGAAFVFVLGVILCVAAFRPSRADWLTTLQAGLKRASTFGLIGTAEAAP